MRTIFFSFLLSLSLIPTAHFSRADNYDPNNAEHNLPDGGVLDSIFEGEAPPTDVRRIDKLAGGILALTSQLSIYDIQHECAYYPKEDRPVEKYTCHKMDTAAGQIFEREWSLLFRCQGRTMCPNGLANGGRMPSDYILQNQRVCADLETGSCEKPALTEADLEKEYKEVFDLLKKLEKERR